QPGVVRDSWAGSGGAAAPPGRDSGRQEKRLSSRPPSVGRRVNGWTKRAVGARTTGGASDRSPAEGSEPSSPTRVLASDGLSTPPFRIEVASGSTPTLGRHGRGARSATPSAAHIHKR